MRSHPYRLTLTLLVATAMLAACNKPDSSSTTDAKPAVEQKVPPMGEVNAAIPPGNIDLTYATVGEPAFNAEEGTLAYKVRVTNNGKVLVSSAGSRPVNLGVIIVGPDGNFRTPPGKRDFVRIKFPRALEPGQSLDLMATFKVAPTIGGSVVLDAVQERVRWFSEYGKPTLALGTFKHCEGSETDICTAEDKPLSGVAN